ncbi:4Fe-4S dicluster domain-containing protein [Candidatus Margulisiibacteriota bacterium]
MDQYFISSTAFTNFVEKLLADSTVIAPVEAFGALHLEEITPDNVGQIKLQGIRTVESFKSHFFKLIEKVSKYFGTDQSPQGKKLTLIGLRSCDLEALAIQDKVFGEGDFQDQFYLANRENVTIISADCTDAGETCFCPAVNVKAYPTKSFDLNLTPLSNGYVVEAGSDKGRKLIDGNHDLFMTATKMSFEGKDKVRKDVENIFIERAKQYAPPGKKPVMPDLAEIHKRNLENKVWKKLTKDCVECSACNFICPTCSCFLLLDQEKNKDSERYKVWDACLKTGYAKVAGGANPRGYLHQRLQNRYHCKFDYSFDRLGRYTCVGCGRCIDGCAGNIDMRQVFMELAKQAVLTAKLE